MAGVDVDRFRSGGGGAGGRRWDLTSGFLDQTGDGDAVVWKKCRMHWWCHSILICVSWRKSDKSL